MPAAKDSPQRRSLSFASLDDLVADIDRLLEAGGGALTTVGKITPAQNIWHVAFFIDGAVTGFDFTVPLPVRLVGRAVRSFVLSRPFPVGIKPPPGASHIMEHAFPPADTTLEEAVAYLRRSVAAVTQGAAMTVPSPLFGKLSHEQWVKLHLQHAELHFSFLYPSEDAAGVPETAAIAKNAA